MERIRQVNLGKSLRAGFALSMSWRFLLAFLLTAGGIFFIAYFGRATTDDLKNNLQQNLDQIQAQINDYKAQISSAQAQAKTLKNQIQILTSKTKQLELEIKQTELVLQQTQAGIDDKTVQINNEETRLERERNLLSQYLQGIYEFDQESMVQLIFSQRKLSDVFSEMNSLEAIQKKTYDTISQIKDIKADLENQKNDLAQKKEDELQLKALQVIQRQALSAQQAEQKKLLVSTNGQEAEYQKLLKKATADATAIKKQIYMLEGVGLSMSLSDAYQHAKYAADRTGVRPAFLLAVLKQETSWGTNVGTGTWRKDMRKQDQTAFVQICDELNLDPNQMPASKKPSYGWGGAMGPAQFLPTTWLAYKDRVATATGHNPPSPWDIDDAFTAAAIKLANDGATVITSDAEWKAAMIYFAGNNWNRPVYSFYGDSVMDLASVIQGQLDIITK